MWNDLLILLGIRARPAPCAHESAADLIARAPELRDLLEKLGYHPRLDTESARLMGELRSSIRAEISDFGAFRSSLAAAIAKRQAIPQASGMFALLDSLSAAPDEDATLAILNADPIHGQVPFIEQIPVLKAGQLAWRSPVDHSLIRRRPGDLAKFLQCLDELERLFSTPWPARAEPPRLEVLDAITRLRRETERDKSYLPTPLEFLETKLAEYGAKSRSAEASALSDTLLKMLDRVEALRCSLAESRPADAWDLAGQVAEQAARYLATPGIHVSWITNRLLSLALHERLTGATGQRVRRRDSKRMELIRREIAAGYFDAAETARRLRRMERRGFDVISLAYRLLGSPRFD